MSIYQEIILDHYRSPHNTGKLKQPTGSVKLMNSVCGDDIELDIKIKNNKIEDIKYRARGCAIFVASSSLLSDYVKDKTVMEITELKSDFIVQLIGVPLSPNRLKCALLPLEALQKVLKSKV